MAIKPFNSVAGFSVGEFPYTTIVQANGDINTTNITTTGVSNLNSVGNVKISGGSAGQVLSTDGAGNLSFITIGTASLNNGTSNVTVLNSGNILFSVAGNANVGVVTGTGINVAGYLNVTGNANVGNLGTAQVLATANITAPQLISNVSTGTAPLVVSSTTLVSNLNADLLDGYNTATANTASTVVVRDTNGNVSANFFIGNGSQLTGLPSGTSIANGNSNVSAGTANGNITVSVAGNANVVVFTGTGVDVTGNLAASGVKTDNLYYANGTPWDLTQPAGSNTQIQYNDGAGGFGASANFTFNDATQLLAVSGTSAQVNVGTNTFITNSYIALGNIGGVYTDVTDTYVAVQDATRYAGISTQNGLEYSNSAFNFVVDETGVYQTNGTGVYNVYGNAGTRAVYGGGASTTINSTEIDWTAADGNAFVANAAGAYHTQKLQAPQLVSNVATGTAPFVVTSTTQVANLNVANAGYATSAGTAGSATTAGTVTTNAQPNITSVGTLTSLAVTGNVSASNFVGALANGNSNVAIPSANGNVNITAVGNTTLVVTGTGANLTGTLNATGNANVGNIGATRGIFTNIAGEGGNISNIQGANVSGAVGSATNAAAVLNNVATTGTVYPTFISSTANGNYSLTSNTAYSANIANGFFGATLLGGTLTTAAQPNITSVGTLSSLAVTANVTAGNVYANSGTIGATTLSASGNVNAANASITANLTANFVTASNGLSITNGALTVSAGNLDVTGNINVTGNLNYSNVTDLVVGDPLIYIGANNTGDLYDLGIVASYNNGTYIHTGIARNHTTDYWTFFDGVVAEPTTVIDWANATYPTVQLGNLIATANANIGGYANVVGNANVGNLGTAGLIVATGNVTGGNLTTSGALSVTGNANVGNIGGGTAIFTTANLTTINSGLVQNGTSNVVITNNGNVTTTAAGNATLVITGTGANIAGYANVTGNVLAGNVYANSGTIGAQTLKGEGGNISNIQGANVSGAVASATTATTAGTVTTNAQPNITSVGTLSALSVTGNVSTGNISGTNGNLTTANISSNVVLGNASVTTQITWASATTSSTSANQTIATFSATGVTGVEYLVKSIDATGSKYGVATVIAVTDGTNVDYSTYGTVQLGGYTGTLAVNIVGGQVRLQVTPASSNSTVWTTQYRLI